MADTASARVDGRPRLSIGGEEFVVDTDPEIDWNPDPVPTPGLWRRADGSMIMAPPRRWYPLVIALATAVVFGYFVLEHSQWWWAGPLFLLLACVKIYTDGLKRYRHSVVFDRRNGLMYFGMGATGRSLASVIAVQVVPFRAGESGGQLHLVFSDLSLPRTSVKALPRQRLTQLPDLGAARDLGGRLAKFLGVALLAPPA
jgi:hypothetical protein